MPRPASVTAEFVIRSARVDIAVVDPESVVAKSALDQYFGELDERFPGGFDPRAGGPDDRDSMRSPSGAFLVVRSDDSTLGCGGVQRIDDRTGEIKRMWIHPAWRGVGLGGRLLDRLEAAARELGRSRVVLDTNETLIEAIRLYERAGYLPIGRYNDNPYAHHWFAKEV